jgi:hypothetical protein
MITVHKFAVGIAGYFDLKMPEGAKVLSVQVQDGVVCIWAKVNTARPLKTIHFGFTGTGIEQHPGVRFAPFIGTVQLGPLVFHLFGGVQETY